MFRVGDELIDDALAESLNIAPLPVGTCSRNARIETASSGRDQSRSRSPAQNAVARSSHWSIPRL
jgi:hypothetical protein